MRNNAIIFFTLAAVTAAGCYHQETGYGPQTGPGAEAPPVFVAHGDTDSYVLVETARDFVAKARTASARPVVYAELPGAQHSFDLFHSVRFERVIDAIEDFAAWVVTRA